MPLRAADGVDLNDINDIRQLQDEQGRVLVLVLVHGEGARAEDAPEVFPLPDARFRFQVQQVALPDHALRVRVGGEVESAELAAVAGAGYRMWLLLLGQRPGRSRGLTDLWDGDVGGVYSFGAERGVEVRLDVGEVGVRCWFGAGVLEVRGAACDHRVEGRGMNGLDAPW